MKMFKVVGTSVAAVRVNMLVAMSNGWNHTVLALLLTFVNFIIFLLFYFIHY